MCKIPPIGLLSILNFVHCFVLQIKKWHKKNHAEPGFRLRTSGFLKFCQSAILDVAMETDDVSTPGRTDEDSWKCRSWYQLSEKQRQKYRKIPKYTDTQKIAVINLKFEQCGCTVESIICRQNGKQYRPWSDCSFRSSLIWVYTVCPGLYVWKLRVIIGKYSNDPKFSDRQVWTNSIDPDQTAPQGSCCSCY